MILGADVNMTGRADDRDVDEKWEAIYGIETTIEWVVMVA